MQGKLSNYECDLIAPIVGRAAELLRVGRTDGEAFQKKYPEARGVFFFSRAGLNAARDEALVSVSYYCGSMCVEGGVFLMVKQDGVWTVEQEVASWQS